MKFTKDIYQVNSDGSIAVIIPRHISGPDGETLEPGDSVTFEIQNVEKQSAQDDTGD